MANPVYEYVIFASFVLAGMRLCSLDDWRAKGRPGAIAIRQPVWKPASKGEIADLFARDLLQQSALRAA